MNRKQQNTLSRSSLLHSNCSIFHFCSFQSYFAFCEQELNPILLKNFAHHQHHLLTLFILPHLQSFYNMGHLQCLLWHLLCSGSEKSFSSASTERNLLLLVKAVHVVAGGEGMASCQRQVPCKQFHTSSSCILYSIHFILRMLQKYRGVLMSNTVPCLSLPHGGLTGYSVYVTEVQSTCCSDSFQLRFVCCGRTLASE